MLPVLIRLPNTLADCANAADNRYAAAACTGTGELTIRAGTARSVVLHMKPGMASEAACRQAITDLAAPPRDCRGSVTIHAIDTRGQPFVVAVDREQEVTCWLWAKGMAAGQRWGTVVTG